MKSRSVIGLLLLIISMFALPLRGIAGNGNALQFDFYGHSITIPFDASLKVAYTTTPTTESIQLFYNAVNAGKYKPAVDALLAFKKQYDLNDWLYYQLIRKTAEQVSPKADNYPRYTLYKWFLLGKSGYDAQLGICKNELVFYVYSDDNIYDIPYYVHDGRQYVCLNKHDYTTLNLLKDPIFPSGVHIPEGRQAFSYKVTQMPDFTPADYSEKDLQFSYNNKLYHFKLKVNPQVQNIFTNYPVVDYESYFNIPLSHETYSSLIPVLKENIKNMKQQQGVDYLMRFTRNSFLYEDDRQNFGKEKRLSPEQTLLYKYSDCDDRAGLFFYLVKEIYNLPMIALVYPTHVTIAVNFDKPVGNTIEYNGRKYTLCEPTPQSKDLKIGEVSREFRHADYQVAYEYIPR
jgi:hypothetical protein